MSQSCPPVPRRAHSQALEESPGAHQSREGPTRGYDRQTDVQGFSLGRMPR
jgi:hypothetical protein